MAQAIGKHDGIRAVGIVAVHLEAAAASLSAGRQAFVKAFRALIAKPPTRYRPEAHYMRGPGPKCREKALRAAPI
jgi:hypothetical protein